MLHREHCVYRVQSRDSDQVVNYFDNQRPVSEQGFHKIVVHRSDKTPVQTADDYENHGDPVDCFHHYFLTSFFV